MDGSAPVSSQRWVCRICGYIYDPHLHGGMAFDDLPAVWRCPGCGFGKAAFVPFEKGRQYLRDVKPKDGQ